MKWLTPLGRFGSALLALGLAFTFLSIIPPAPIGNWGGPAWSFVTPESVTGESSGVFTSRTGFQISLTSNTRIQFYILAKYPTLREPKPSYLEDYLQEHPDEIFFAGTIDKELSLDFFPPKVTEVWFVYSNPSAMLANVTKTLRYETVLLTKEQVMMPTVILIVSGGVLVVPSVMRRKE